MSNSQQRPWSDDLNAPKIPYDLYFEEKANLAGIFIGSILYGTVIVLFFKCMAALFDPAHRRGEGIKWGLVSYAVVMFSVATVLAATGLNVQSYSYVDHREFPGVADGVVPPGPLGYQGFIHSNVLSIIPDVMFFLTNWLADGLLLYRCYVIYAKHLWIIVFPCLMYLGSLVMGLMYICQASVPTRNVQTPVPRTFGLPHLSISVSLNVLLTLMIIIRLVLHVRNIRAAMGTAGMGGLCKSIVTMLIESCTLYTVSSLLLIGPWVGGNPAASIFLGVLTQTQVIAPLLIIQRVANKSALTSNSVVSGRLSFRARGREESTSGGGVLSNGYPVGSVGRHEYRNNSGEVEVEAEIAIDFLQNKA